MAKRAVLVLAALTGLLAATAMAQTSGDLAYTPDGKMVFPKDYRDWIYLSTGFDMSYVEGAADAVHKFDTVFVNRAAYEGFRSKGAWPDKTVMVLEVRGASTNDFNKRGQFQSGAPFGVEAHVKDVSRGGWSFYAFGKTQAPGALLDKSQACYSCHEQHGQTDTTFTQFYPMLAK